MKFEVITLFPEFFELSLRQSLLGKAIDKKLFEIEIINLRDYATDRHNTVDDTPFGGGGGMVLKVEPIDRCLAALGYTRRGEESQPNGKEKILLTSAAGRKFDQRTAIGYSLCDRLAIICGHYQGVDERITRLYRMEEVSIGDYVLTGGEPAATVIVDAVARLIPKVLGNFESATDDSHMDEIVGAPSYTRPAEYEALEVPAALLSGNHREIDKYRRRMAIEKCLRNRPDLLKQAELTEDEQEMVRQLDENLDIE
ncbi:MAG: tRNA (guanosine(37)-N1)-methyltransferase TrmD [candidate division Zixibacteria bacterium]|nr:tRNA (guanosine(37)-N1)-methyltransferase TrmD [candidate division Zixibacteria bacterium]